MFNNEFFLKKMEEYGYTQLSLAERLGVSGALICYLIKGLKQPSFALTVRIARVFNCTIDDLVKGE